MLDEPHFHAVSDATLEHLYDQLEDAYDDGDIEDIELADGVLRIEAASGNVWIINKHSASRQIWMTSIHDGGLHFSFNHDRQDWELPDGRELKALLAEEIHEITNRRVTF